jgi:hypothetical protein
MTRCTFKQGNYNCGSYAFNLYKEDIDQGSYCDRHYWQNQAQKARADEREACAKVCDEVNEHPSLTPQHCAESIRARGEQA